MLKFWTNLAGPCPAPTYLPTYLPLWETKKEIMGRVKVGYYTNIPTKVMVGGTLLHATTVLPET